MATDFRIMCGFFTHPKTLKLKSRHGSDGGLALQVLWEWATQWRPKGELYDMTEEDILLACGMNTAPQEQRQRFVKDLIEIRWLDVDERGTMSLHSWEQRQPWVFKEEERKEQARANAQARWEKRKKEDGSKGGKTPRKGAGRRRAGSPKSPAALASRPPRADGNADGNAPFLSFPYHSEKDILSEREASGLAERLWELIQANNPKTKPPKLENWAKEIGRMLRLDGRSPEDARAVIEWSQQDQFWNANILSAEALRRNFDQLMAKMARETRSDKSRKDDPGESGGMSEEEYLRQKRSKG